MGETNAYVVEVPRMYGHGAKKVVLSSSIEDVIDFLKKQMKIHGMEGCRIESIVLIGEVLNG